MRASATLPSSPSQKLTALTPRLSNQVVRIALALLLLSAAAFKAHALWTDTAQPFPLLHSLRAQIAVIQIEALIGLWLLTGVYPHVARWIALCLFSTLAAASLYLGVRGESSCGCWGRLQVNPWITFAVDISAVIALALCRFPPPQFTEQSYSWIKSAGRLLGGAAAILAVAGGVFLLIANDPWSQLARWRGEFIIVEPPVSDLGSAPLGERRSFTINLANYGDRYVTCIGGTTTCACTATEDLPITVSPGESKPIRVRMVYRGSTGLFQHRFVLYTDEERQKFVVARFIGEVTEPPTIKGRAQLDKRSYGHERSELISCSPMARFAF
jgi:hypothetical protein